MPIVPSWEVSILAHPRVAIAATRSPILGLRQRGCQREASVAAQSLIMGLGQRARLLGESVGHCPILGLGRMARPRRESAAAHCTNCLAGSWLARAGCHANAHCPILNNGQLARLRESSLGEQANALCPILDNGQLARPRWTSRMHTVKLQQLARLRGCRFLSEFFFNLD